MSYISAVGIIMSGDSMARVGVDGWVMSSGTDRTPFTGRARMLARYYHG
jgi:hypothetical protein